MIGLLHSIRYAPDDEPNTGGEEKDPPANEEAESKDEDATELTFQDVVEDIQDVFENQYSLGGTVINSGPIQVKLIENRKFGSVLCHYAELELEAHERVMY